MTVNDIYHIVSSMVLYIDLIVRTIFTFTVSFLIFKRSQFQSMSILARISFVGFII